MEKENFYSIVDEMCTYNFQSYFENLEWYKESLASQVEIDSSQSESKAGLREEIISQMDDLHKRKIKLFEKKFKSYKELESKEPHLTFVPNHPADRYVYLKYINWERFDPATNPNELIYLAKELLKKKFEEVFYQPVNEKFMKNLEEFIKSKITLSPEQTQIIIESKKDKKIINIDSIEKKEIKEAKEEKTEAPAATPIQNIEKEKLKPEIKEIKKDILIAALDIYYILNIYQGNYTKIANFHNFLKKNNYPRYTDYLSKNFSSVDYALKATLNKLFVANNNYEPYPIMRNWAINDVFNMTKNLLFIQNKGIYSLEKLPSTAICTDSKYLYIILYGICGGIYKVGTGKNGTIKGQIYAKNIVVNTYENNPMMVYVKNTKKIYLKTNQNTLGHIKIIDPENLTVEKIINLNIPQSAKSKSVVEKNQNYILLSDDNYLYTIMLEEKPAKKKEKEDYTFDSTYKYNYLYSEKRYKKKEYGSAFIDVSLCLYQYSLNETVQIPIETENDKLVNELFESFSYLFPKEKCKYALEKNGYDIAQAAEFLIKISQENKQIEIKVKPPQELYKNYEVSSKNR